MDDTVAAAAREILARWALAQPGHPCDDFAAKISLVSVAEKPSFIVRLMTLYDIRTIAGEGRQPFPEGTALPAGAADAWSREPELKKDFFGQEASFVVPAAKEPKDCPGCEGSGLRVCPACGGNKTKPCPACTRGNKACPQCGGKGKISCPHCKGLGQVVNSIAASGQELRTPCPSCAGTGGPQCPQCASTAGFCKTCQNSRVVPCADCKSQGRLPCPDCQGSRRILPTRTYKVEYQPISSREVLPDPETPQGLLPADPPQRALGKLVYEAAAEGKLALPRPLPDAALQKAAETLLQRAEAGAEGFAGNARIIKQQLCVDRIAVYAVAYEYALKKYYCWATELDDHVWSAENPFTELAGQKGREALDCLSRGQYARAEELRGQAAALGGAAWVEGLKPLFEQGRERAAQSLGRNLGLGIVCAAALLLALDHRLSHHLFWPLAAYAVAALAATLLGWRFGGPKVRTPAGAAALAGGAAALAALVFTLANPVRRLDAGEFRGLLEARLGEPVRTVLSAEDVGYLQCLIADYAPLGVDVSSAQAALEANAKRLDAERQEAQRQEELRRQQAAADAAAAAQRQKELVAARGSLKTVKRVKPSGKKAKKKKSKPS
jgi:hypothetical protein